MNDPDFPLTKIGKVAILSGLTKAMTAFAVLQNVTHKRTMKHMKISILWKGLVVEEEEESSRALIQYQQSNDTQPQPPSTISSEEQHTDVIHELEDILANTSTDHRAAEENDDQCSINADNNSTSLISLSSATSAALNGRSIDLSLDDNGNPYNMYEITTTTNRITTRTTRIRPIDVNGNRQMNAKQVVERTNEEDKESFIAVIDHQVENQPRDRAAVMPEDAQNADPTPKNSWNHTDKGRPGNNKFRIMLSSVSKKLSRKKVERQTKYGLVKNQSHHEQDMEDTVEGPITTMTSTSTTLQQQQSSTQYVASAPHENNSHSSGMRLTHAPSLTDHSSDDDIGHDPLSYSEPENKPKRRMSWSGLKMNLNKKKSVSNLFQRGVDAINNSSSNASDTASSKKKKSTNKHSKAPPVPMLPTTKQNTSSNMPYLQKSNSINSLTSLSSIARTLKTTTYYTTPASPPPPNAPSSATPSTSRSLVRSPSVPARLHSKPASASSLDQEPNPQNFPQKHIISNIAHFIRYASAAYGESFMRILGIGKIPSVLPNSHHPNHHAFAHHTGVSIQDILLSSYTDNHLLSSVSLSKPHALVHYVTVDHYAKAIVLTCRGTLGLGDVLTDLTCDYREFTLPTDSVAHGEEANGGHQRTYVAHGGMLEAAQILAVQKGKVFEAIKKGLESYPHYGLVLCGHSLGAGVASLLSVLWSEEKLHFLSRRMMSNQDHDSDGSKLPRKFLDSFAAASIKKVSCPFVTSELSGLPAGRPIHCYTYGSPCVMSLELSQYCAGLVTSVVHGNDIVSGLSLGLLKDFKNIAVSLHEDSHVTDEILSRVIGHYQQGKKAPSSSSQQQQQQQHKQDPHQQHSDEDEDQWFWALIKTFRADMLSQKLFPPSTMYLIESVPQLVQHTESNSTTSHPPGMDTRMASKHKRAHMVKFSRCDDVQARFSEIVFSRTMFMDHSPNMYENAIQQLNKGYFGQY